MFLPNGLMNGMKVIFSPPGAGKLYPGCIKTHVDILSLRLKKQIEETATYCQRTLFMDAIKNDFFLYNFKETEAQRCKQINLPHYFICSSFYGKKCKVK